MHQRFWTKRSIFVLVWNLLQPRELFLLEYWLDLIERTIKGSHVILIGTHADDKSFENNDTLNELLSGVSTRFSRFNRIRSIISFSSSTGAGVETLKNTLETLLRDESFLKERVPFSYVALNEVLSDEKNRRKLPIVSLKTTTQIASYCKIPPSEIARAMQTLSTLGSFFYFQEPSFNLHTVAFLDPKWLYKQVDVLLENKQNNIVV